jgi:hypothetical protein
MNYNVNDDNDSSIILWSTLPIYYDTNKPESIPVIRDINYFYNFDNNYNFNYNKDNESAFNDNNQLSIINESDISLLTTNTTNQNSNGDIYNYWALLALILVFGTAGGMLLSY